MFGIRQGDLLTCGRGGETAGWRCGGARQACGQGPEGLKCAGEPGIRSCRIELKGSLESGCKFGGAEEETEHLTMGGGDQVLPMAPSLKGRGAVVEERAAGRTGLSGSWENLRPRGPGQAGASGRVERRPLPLLTAPHCAPRPPGLRQGAGLNRSGSPWGLGSLKGAPR